MPYPSININIVNGATNTDDSLDNVALLVVVDTGSVNSVAHLQTAELYSEAQANTQLNINAADDANSIILRHYHIAEFFRKNPNGRLHFLNINGTAASPSDVGDIATATYNYIKTQGGKIKQVAVAFNSPAANFLNILHGGTSSGGAVGFQSIADNLRNTDFMPVDVFFLEGSNLSSMPAPDFRAKNCPNVAIVLGNDADFMDAGNQDFVGTCAVGTVLGCSTNKQLHDSFAWVGNPTNNLTDTAKNKFLRAAIFGLTSVQNNTTADLTQLDAYGYVFPRTFPNMSGVYWSQSNNCVAENTSLYNTERVQVVNKAYRVLYQALFPYINQKVDIDAQGRLSVAQRTIIANEITNAINANMGENINEITLVMVDPAKDANNVPYPSILADKTLRAWVGIRPFGKAEQIRVELSLTSQTI